jgi:alkylation response protein AidB-like acyl-CoA dehydrogenase
MTLDDTSACNDNGSGRMNAIDEEDLLALQEGIAQVLEDQADRHRLHDHIDGKVRLDRDLWQRAGELGWLGMGLPEQYNGLAFGARGLDVLHRELGQRVAPGPFLASLSAAQAIAEAADEKVRDAWLAPLATGECKLAVVAQTLSEAAGDDTWLLGDVDSDAALVPLEGGRWGLVPIAEANRIEVWDRTRTMFTAKLSGAAPLAELDGEAVSNALTLHMCLGLASESIGAARAITEITIAYMKEREQFGKVIASFQALKHRVADMMTMVVSAEEIVSLAAESAAAGEPDAQVWASLAKVRASEVLIHCANEALQLHGGVGFTWEFDVHLYLMRSRLNEMLVAPNAQLRDRAAAGFERSFAAGRQPLEFAIR